MRKPLLCAAAAIGVALAAGSATAADTPAAAAKPPAAKEEPKQICRNIVQTGTRIRRTKKVCATAQEWQRSSDAIADDFHGLSGNPIVPETSNVPG